MEFLDSSETRDWTAEGEVPQAQGAQATAARSITPAPYE